MSRIEKKGTRPKKSDPTAVMKGWPCETGLSPPVKYFAERS